MVMKAKIKGLAFILEIYRGKASALMRMILGLKMQTEYGSKSENQKGNQASYSNEASYPMTELLQKRLLS
jgi:hypothetical protein